MMLLLVLALATMPQPVGRAIPGDLGMTATLIGVTRPAATRVEVTVNAAGVPVHCAVVQSDGLGVLDRTACGQMMHTRFVPAHDGDGRPVAAVVRQDFTVNAVAPLRYWNGPAAGSRRIDFAVPVAGLARPDEVPVADVLVITDTAGRVTHCDVIRPTQQAALDRLACRQVATATFAPAQDVAGQPVVAMRAVSIGFTGQPVPQ